MERCIMTLKNIIDEALNSQQLAMSVKELENVANNKMLGQQLGLKLNADAAPQFQQLAKQILDQKKKELMQATAAEQAQKQAAAKAQQQQRCMTLWVTLGKKLLIWHLILLTLTKLLVYFKA